MSEWAALLDRVVESVGQHLRLVVDDASHVNALTVQSFDILFPKLPSSGLYVIEDLSPSSYEGENDRADIDRLIGELARDADGMGSGRWGSGRTVAFVHSWPGLLFVGRA